MGKHAKSRRPVGRPSRFPKKSNSEPDIEKACKMAYDVTAAGGGKKSVAAAFDVSYQTYLDWTNPECPRYKGKEFSDSVERGLIVGEGVFMDEVREHMVEEQDEGRVNMGVVKFIAQHRYGLVDRQQIETTPLNVNISQDLADDVG